MRRTLHRMTPLLLLTLMAAAGCSSTTDLSRPKTQDNFGVEMARMNLWREAMFRFQRAVEINPGDAQAHNNLAVAYEANGDFEKARKEYLEALRLDRTNPYIQKNYSRYVEFLSRNRKRQTPKGTATALPPGTPARAVGGVSNLGPPDKPAVAQPPSGPPSPPSTVPPSDRPQPPTQQPQPPTPAAQPQPTPPPTPPPGGAR